MLWEVVGVELIIAHFVMAANVRNVSWIFCDKQATLFLCRLIVTLQPPPSSPRSTNANPITRHVIPPNNHIRKPAKRYTVPSTSRMCYGVDSWRLSRRRSSTSTNCIPLWCQGCTTQRVSTPRADQHDEFYTHHHHHHHHHHIRLLVDVRRSHTVSSNNNRPKIVPEYLKGKKGKASSLDIAPLTILNSGKDGALQPRKWQLTGNDCSTAAHAVAAHAEPTLTDYWAHSCSQQAYYVPVNHARSSPRNPCT